VLLARGRGLLSQGLRDPLLQLRIAGRVALDRRPQIGPSLAETGERLSAAVPFGQVVGAVAGMLVVRHLNRALGRLPRWRVPSSVCSSAEPPVDSSSDGCEVAEEFAGPKSISYGCLVFTVSGLSPWISE